MLELATLRYLFFFRSNPKSERWEWILISIGKEYAVLMENFQSHMNSNLPKNVTLLLQIWTQHKFLTGISSSLNF